jgi:hypothetical protein
MIESFAELEDKAEETRSKIIKSLNLIDDPGWNLCVKNIVVILSASRSGSSLIFKALTTSNKVIAPAGEHEPWMFLSKNKYPFIKSDLASQLNNADILLKLLRNDLLVRQNKVEAKEIFSILKNRFAIRGEFFQQELLRDYENNYKYKNIDKTELNKIISSIIAKASEYETALSNIHSGSYFAVENPPYIKQPLARRFLRKELSRSTLLFKSPCDAYRNGMYEHLFPNAKIIYVHLTRGIVQTVNGLIDGWTKNPMDFISNHVGIEHHELKIIGYNQKPISNVFWCFDLFDDWWQYKEKTLVEVCVKQWLSAQAAIRNYHLNSSCRLAFEEFYSNKAGFIKKLEKITKIKIKRFDWNTMVMQTDKPSAYRWIKRQEVFSDLQKYLKKDLYEQAVDMQIRLGYSLDESTWY